MQWYDKAACNGSDPEAFFVETRGHNYENTTQRICASCPVKNDCLKFAIKYRMQGYWGGTTEQQRRSLKRYGMVA
jgi:hypothetical protein